MINAPITPGTHPQRVSRKTIRTEPQPLSMTARGGQMMQIITRKQPMGICDLRLSIFDYPNLQSFPVQLFNFSNVLMFIRSNQVISSLKYFQPEIRRVIRVIIEEFFNRSSGLCRMMPCQGGRDPAAREENITSAFYLFKHLQRREYILLRTLCHHRVVKISKGFDYPRFMFTVHRVTQTAEESIPDCLI